MPRYEGSPVRKGGEDVTLYGQVYDEIVRRFRERRIGSAVLLAIWLWLFFLGVWAAVAGAILTVVVYPQMLPWTPFIIGPLFVWYISFRHKN